MDNNRSPFTLCSLFVILVLALTACTKDEDPILTGKWLVTYTSLTDCVDPEQNFKNDYSDSNCVLVDSSLTCYTTTHEYFDDGRFESYVLIEGVLPDGTKETIIEFDVFGEYTLEGDMLILCYDNDPVCEEFTMTLSDDSYTNIFHVTDESSDRFGCIGEERAVRTQ